MLSKKALPYLYILVMIAVCIIFGSRKWLTIVGFNAIAAMFAIAVILSFLLRNSLNSAPKRGEDDDEDS